MTLLEYCVALCPGEAIFSLREGRLTIETRRLCELENKGCPAPFSQWEPALGGDGDGAYTTDDQWFGARASDILGSVLPARAECFYGCAEAERLTLTEEETSLLEGIRLIIDPEVKGVSFHVRRPYFRMRGRPVTREQAFDIIRRTDSFFRWDMEDYHLEGLVGDRWILDNVWYSPQFYPHPRGWVRPDGVVGTNDITGKYPEERELVASMLPLKAAFPYLDLMIGMTDWDESPPYAWDAYFGKDGEAGGDREAMRREDYPDFLDHIVYGIWLHDDAVELMGPRRAREKYAEYSRLYSGPDEGIFAAHYYHDRKQHPADLTYLKRCIRSHGLDPQEVLKRYRWGEDGLADRQR